MILWLDCRCHPWIVRHLEPISVGGISADNTPVETEMGADSGTRDER